MRSMEPGYWLYFSSTWRVTTACTSRYWRDSLREVTRLSRWRTSLGRFAWPTSPTWTFRPNRINALPFSADHFPFTICDDLAKYSKKTCPMWTSYGNLRACIEPHGNEENYRYKRIFWLMIEFWYRLFLGYRPCFKYTQNSLRYQHHQIIVVECDLEESWEFELRP